MCFPPAISFLESVFLKCFYVHLEKLKVLLHSQSFHENTVYFLLVHFFEMYSSVIELQTGGCDYS